MVCLMIRRWWGGKVAWLAFMQIIPIFQSWLQYPASSWHLWSLQHQSTPIPNPSKRDNRWRHVCIPEQLDWTRQQMLSFYFSVFAQSFGGMVGREGQRAKAKYLGSAGTTAGRTRPGSRFTSLKTQHESNGAFLALPTLMITLLLPPKGQYTLIHMAFPTLDG